MKPVLILQHESGDGPAYLGRWLARAGVPADVRDANAGNAFPDSLVGHAALAILGGAMSANDPLPTLRQAERLIREAVEREVPMLGHCLGGQLMARALGAAVHTSPAPEVGWQVIEIADDPLARAWFGPDGRPSVFQWHYDAFDLPQGALRLAGNAACPNQAFAIGPHLAMQFHVEVDAAKLARWADDLDDRYFEALARHGNVHSVERMQADTALHLAAQQRMADRMYARWWAAAARR